MRPAPPTPPPATAGHLSALSVPGVGHLQILRCPWAGHLSTPGPTPNVWHARGFLSEYNYAEDLTEKKTSWLAHLSRKKLKRIVEVCSRFYACISKLLIKPGLLIGSYRRESTFFGYWIKFLLILFEEHPFIFIKLFITYNFTALY